ncbi:hypothetical protein [Actinomadura sp. NEAU-AAG7]|uniref:hypothetical protein n=1 Tax=Actinomadura sp. NEAU-AAG7 TaxID=2839640 RepID=UPI001BE3D94F|nr:hypothetical protein [Actinomadura sp. NEAU-AAG7]MBT2212663.1 hypothetical protein [Actinomadura sp. NEAU-AAG7]
MGEMAVVHRENGERGTLLDAVMACTVHDSILDAPRMDVGIVAGAEVEVEAA